MDGSPDSLILPERTYFWVISSACNLPATSLATIAMEYTTATLSQLPWRVMTARMKKKHHRHRPTTVLTRMALRSLRAFMMGNLQIQTSKRVRRRNKTNQSGGILEVRIVNGVVTTPIPFELLCIRDKLLIIRKSSTIME